MPLITAVAKIQAAERNETNGNSNCERDEWLEYLTIEKLMSIVHDRANKLNEEHKRQTAALHRAMAICALEKRCFVFKAEESSY